MLGLAECLEETCLCLGRNADATVTHFEFQEILVTFTDVDRLPVNAQVNVAGVRKLECVAEQVEQDLAQPCRIAFDQCRRARCHRAEQFDLFAFCLAGEHGGAFETEFIQVKIKRLDVQLARFYS